MRHRHEPFRSCTILTLALAVATIAAASQRVIDPARFISYDTLCRPTLTGSEQVLLTPHDLDFDVAGAVPNTQMVQFFGSWRTAVPLQVGGTALTNTILSVPGMADAKSDGHSAAPFGLFASDDPGVLVPGISPMADPTTQTSYPCYYIQIFNWNYGGDGVSVVTGKIRWPSSTCSLADGPPPDRPVVIFLHGNNMSHTNHDYLMAHLARNGFVTASVANGDFLSGRNEGRARQAISFLNSLHAFWGWRSRLSDNVAFVGHSRGGEASATAARMLGEQPSLGHVAYDVRAVISIAPTDGGGTLSDPKETLNGAMTDAFLAIYGSDDEDVRGHRIGDPVVGPQETGFAIYDRAGAEGSSEGLLIPGVHVKKSFVYVHGGTHRGFLNTCSPFGFAAVSCSQHRNIARGYLNAFLRWHMFGETTYRVYFDGSHVPTAVQETDVELFAQLSDIPRRVVDNFEQPGWNSSTIGVVVSQSAGIAQLAEGELYQLDATSPNDTRGMRIKWQNSPTPHVRWSIPNENVPVIGPKRDVTPYDYLSLRVAQSYGDAWNVPGQDQDFYVRLYTGAGWSPYVRISDHGRIPYPDQFVYPLAPQGDYTKSPLQTVRLPLSAFTGANLTDVRWIYFYFDVPGHEFGSVNVDSVEFVN